MVKARQKLPKWFDGELYEIGDEVRNPFSGERYVLTAEELSMYDFIMGCQIAFETFDLRGTNMIDDFDKGRDWFRKTNPKAYMVLLD